MPRENETYRDRLVYNREKLESLKEEGKIPHGVEELNLSHAQMLIGKSRKTLRQPKYSALYGFVDGHTTVEKISRAQSREATTYSHASYYSR